MNPGQLLNGSFTQLREALDEGQVSAEALTDEALRRARESQGLNALISVLEEEARTEARAADARLQAGERGGVLGLPVLVKDLILTRGQRTTAASKMLENFRAPYDATVVARLRAAGAPIVGKTNLDEFAMGSSNETSHFGASQNPWDPARVPGGSSGGSAAAVAARISPLALGTDTGGSIRQPSSFCGITGLKPTYGRVSRFGVIAFASSLDQVGPMAADAAGAAALLQAIAGHDTHDGTSTHKNVEAFAGPRSWKGVRVGLPREYFALEGLSAEVRQAVEGALDILRGEGAEMVEISLPHTRFSLPVYYLICTSEASSNLARYDGVHYGYRSPRAQTLEQVYSFSRGEGLGDEVRLRILLGTFALSSGYYDAYYRKASQVRALIKKDFVEAFSLCDVIAGPTSPTTAFRLGEKRDDPLAMYAADVYTLATNLAGLPGISFNVGFAQGLPVGLQLMAPWWEENKLLGWTADYQAKNPDSLRLSPVAQSWEAGR